MKTNFALVLIVLSLNSCYIQPKDERRNNFDSIKQAFRSDLVSHIPKYNQELYYSYTKEIEKPGPGPDVFIVFRKYDIPRYLELKDSIQKVACCVFNPNDTSLLRVFGYIYLPEYKSFTITDIPDFPEGIEFALENKIKEAEFPVPLFNFNDFNLIDRKSNFGGEGYKIFGLKAETGNFNQKEKPIHEFLPKKWIHGYSKGFCLNDEETIIVYWVMLW